MEKYFATEDDELYRQLKQIHKRIDGDFNTEDTALLNKISTGRDEVQKHLKVGLLYTIRSHSLTHEISE